MKSLTSAIFLICYLPAVAVPRLGEIAAHHFQDASAAGEEEVAADESRSDQSPAVDDSGDGESDKPKGDEPGPSQIGGPAVPPERGSRFLRGSISVYLAEVAARSLAQFRIYSPVGDAKLAGLGQYAPAVRVPAVCMAVTASLIQRHAPPQL